MKLIYMEYYTFATVAKQTTDRKLTSMGSEGWELVFMVPYIDITGVSWIRYVLRKPRAKPTSRRNKL